MKYTNPESLPSFEIAESLGMSPHMGATAQLGDSAHKVCVAEDDKLNLWVIKPGSHDKARVEVDMLNAMQRDGVPTLVFDRGKEPRLVPYDEDTTAIVMQFRRLMPLTRLDWGANVYDEPSHEVLDRHGMLAMHTIAKMHKRGYYHGDFQAKNNGLMTTSNGYRRQVCFDFEGAGHLGHWAEEDNQHKIMADDIVQFFKSILINRYLEELPLDLKMQRLGLLALQYAQKLSQRNPGAEEAATNIAIEIETQTEDWVSQPGSIKRARQRFKNSRTS